VIGQFSGHYFWCQATRTSRIKDLMRWRRHGVTCIIPKSIFIFGACAWRRLGGAFQHEYGPLFFAPAGLYLAGILSLESSGRFPLRFAKVTLNQPRSRPVVLGLDANTSAKCRWHQYFKTQPNLRNASWR